MDLVKSIDNGGPVTCAAVIDPNTIWAGSQDPLLRLYTGFQNQGRELTVRVFIQNSRTAVGLVIMFHVM
jgi:hypothetical protein